MTHKSETLRSILPERKEGTITSVVVLPEKMRFETQNPNERVYIMLRRHIITNLGWILSSIVMILIPPITLFILSRFDVDMAETFGLKTGYVLTLIAIWYLFVFSTSFMNFLEWWFNIYVITSERVLDFDFSPFAYHKISEAGLESIEDATQENIGFLPMLFNYGDVYIQTAAQKREFDFTAVPKPAWVRDKIMDLRDMVMAKPS
jgi:hypothetical protein